MTEHVSQFSFLLSNVKSSVEIKIDVAFIFFNKNEIIWLLMPLPSGFPTNRDLLFQRKHKIKLSSLTSMENPQSLNMEVLL